MCDSCCTKAKEPPTVYHLHDCILLEEKSVNPGHTSALVWRVARIVQLDNNIARVELFERFSDWAKGKASVEYVSEVRPLKIFRGD